MGFASCLPTPTRRGCCQQPDSFCQNSNSVGLEAASTPSQAATMLHIYSVYSACLYVQQLQCDLKCTCNLHPCSYVMLHNMHRFYSRRFVSVATAAKAADLFIYKAQGPTAATNFPISQATMDLVDGMSMEEVG
eukprot:357464-Chlamydomonas_euryale.AAC.2